ncbi:MAG: sarcosine oxidase subunit alpha [Rhodobacterales bacterium]|nr:MAG: sarcosine oxidase subunit alpha [Rhodobacterales bacterium]
MSARIEGWGRLIDRSQPKHFTFDGQSYRGFAGDTLASALLGAGRLVMGRSYKLHRPRGLVASGPEEPNILVGLGTGGRIEPETRATTVELADGLVAKSQNGWPSVDFDLMAVNQLAARFMSAGFYYKTFMAPSTWWYALYEPIIRKSAGLAKAPKGPDPDSYEYLHAHYDVVVVGGGVAGLAAAKAAAASGVRVLVLEQAHFWGGRAPVDAVAEAGPEGEAAGGIDGQPQDEWIRNALEDLENQKNVTLRLRTQAVGVYDHGYLVAEEKLSGTDPRRRLWRIRAGRIVSATGAIERPLAFAGNDRPGVMLASAMRDYLVNWGVAVGERIVLVTNNDDAYRTALAMQAAGAEVIVIEARGMANGPLAERAKRQGIQLRAGRAVAEVLGGRRVKAVRLVPLRAGEAGEEIACDAVAMSGGWSPVVHLWSHCGGKLVWDAAQALYRPDPEHPPRGADGAGFVHSAGAASGVLTLAGVLDDAWVAGEAAGIGAGGTAVQAGAPSAAPETVQPLEPVWIMPADAGPAKRAKMWLDFQNDVKVSDVQLAAQEGYESVEQTKRYTTLGMANDQGKTSNINGLAVLSGALGQAIPETGTTTFRPPYTPLTFGSIAGEARGKLFLPLRRTPLHGWHEAHGADWEPVGQWRRPYCYRQEGETRAQAVSREVSNTREHVGLLDASTLGKLLVKGPDAGRFLDMMYTNMMSTLPVGKCRYGLMCSENGFLIDDGVVARLDDETWLCHTTTGGAERIHGHMEDWLQCEWWDWKVHVVNLTEQFAQIAVVGPKARQLLESLGGMDVSKAALPFMHWAGGELAGFPVRIYRISFSGELSYEIAVEASLGQALWDRLMADGKGLGIMPYGTEALHVMRAEKGFIMIGDETDGTVIPQDLGLGWALSKKKADFLGKRAHARPEMARDSRWKLVGLETTDGSVLPDGAYIVAEGQNANGQRNTEGRVTSSYHSPTLGRGIAMGLVLHGPARMGETVQVARIGAEPVAAKIVDPCFYDKEGAKQDV